MYYSKFRPSEIEIEDLTEEEEEVWDDALWYFDDAEERAQYVYFQKHGYAPLLGEDSRQCSVEPDGGGPMLSDESDPLMEVSFPRCEG